MSPDTPSNTGRPAETYTLEQLSECTDVPIRTIRYYIQRGLVSRPEGEKKGAYYLRSHLEQLLQIRKWVGAGMSLDRVAALLHVETPATLPQASSRRPLAATSRRDVSVYHLTEGLELVIDPLRCPLSPAEIAGLLTQIESILNFGESTL
ncbi:MAG: helix-turn-helix domain-containing protein [Moraxellaceae bacterium]|nr:helix-turn-helix domain-containing protein [Moraxellaceae bacterium]